MSARLNWQDRAAVSKWLLNLRVAIDDAESVTADMLRPPRRRDLGPRLHREQAREARNAVRQLLAFAEPAAPDPEPSDPAGCGGSPAH